MDAGNGIADQKSSMAGANKKKYMAGMGMNRAESPKRELPPCDAFDCMINDSVDTGWAVNRGNHCSLKHAHTAIRRRAGKEATEASRAGFMRPAGNKKRGGRQTAPECNKKGEVIMT